MERIKETNKTNITSRDDERVTSDTDEGELPVKDETDNRACNQRRATLYDAIQVMHINPSIIKPE